MLWIFLRVYHKLVEDGGEQPVEHTVRNVIEFWIGLLESHVSCDAWTDVLEEVIKTLGVLYNVSVCINFWNSRIKIFITRVVT